MDDYAIPSPSELGKVGVYMQNTVRQRVIENRGKNETVEVILFDLGGVVIEIDFARSFAIWSEYSGVSPKVIQTRFRFDLAYERHEKGEIHAESYFEALRFSLGIDLSDDEFAEGWQALYVGLIAGMPELLLEVKERIPLFAFTNSNRTHQKFWAREYAQMLETFDQVFVSSEIGMRKPDPTVFDYISKQIGVLPSRILFFDDIIENVEGARAVGMQAVQVTSIVDVIDNLPFLVNS